MKISEWLANTGTSQSELARRLGITQGRVSQLVAGAQPSLDLAMKIAALTGKADQMNQHLADIALSSTSCGCEICCSLPSLYNVEIPF